MLSGSILSLMGVSMLFFRVPFFGVVVLSPDLAPLITVLTVVLFANAINLVDGLDGLAAGIVAIAGTAVFLYSDRLFKDGFLTGSNIAPLVAMIAVGICVGFLPWNFSPARIFMGDAGAMFLGLLMAVCTITLGGRADYEYSGQTYFFFAPLFIPLVILGVPLLDTAFSFFRRVLRRRSFSVADKDHLHHRLMRLGHGPRRTVVILWLWTALLSGLALLPLYTSEANAYVPVGILALALGALRRLRPGQTARGPRNAGGEELPPERPRLPQSGGDVVDLTERRQGRDRSRRRAPGRSSLHGLTARPGCNRLRKYSQAGRARSRGASSGRRGRAFGGGPRSSGRSRSRGVTTGSRRPPSSWSLPCSSGSWAGCSTAGSGHGTAVHGRPRRPGLHRCRRSRTTSGIPGRAGRGRGEAVDTTPAVAQEPGERERIAHDMARHACSHPGRAARRGARPGWAGVVGAVLGLVVVGANFLLSPDSWPPAPRPVAQATAFGRDARRYAVLIIVITLMAVRPAQHLARPSRARAHGRARAPRAPVPRAPEARAHAGRARPASPARPKTDAQEEGVYGESRALPLRGSTSCSPGGHASTGPFGAFNKTSLMCFVST